MGTKVEIVDGRLTLPSGEEVHVRGLSGLEVALIGKRNGQLTDDPDAPGGIAIQIGFCVLGHKKVADAERAGIEWLETHSGADFQVLGDVIQQLSGFGQGAAKSVVD